MRSTRGVARLGRVVTRAWGVRTSYARRALAPELARALALDVASFKRAACSAAAGSVRAYTRVGGAPQEIAIRPDQIDELFWAGMTVAIFDLHEVHAPAFELVGALREATGFAGPMVATAFLSPPGSGYGLHFDEVSVLNLQLQGTKRWRVGAEPALRHPLVPAKLEDLAHVRERHGWLDAAPPRPADLRPVTMAPNDALFFPPGTWHEAAGADASLSLGVTFRETPRSRALADRLCDALNRREAWRAPAGATPSPTEGGDALAELLGRLDEALARDEATSTTAPAPAPGVEPRLAARGDRLRVASPFRFGPAPGGADDLQVVTARGSFHLGAEARPLLERLATLETFAARDVLAWPRRERLVDGWADARQLLAELVALGLLAPVSARAARAAGGSSRRGRGSRSSARPGRRRGSRPRAAGPAGAPRAAARRGGRRGARS
jgi:hypothetical protein